MKVKELIELLKKCNQDALVVMSSDEEGNDYHEFSGDISTQYKFRKEYHYTSIVNYKEIDQELGVKEDYDNEDYYNEAIEEENESRKNDVDCVVLWP